MISLEECIRKSAEVQRDLLKWAENNDVPDGQTDGIGHGFTFVAIEVMNACIFAATKGKIKDSRSELLDLMLAMQKSANGEDQMFR